MRKTVLVTGSTGFMATHIIPALNKEYDVIGIDNRPPLWSSEAPFFEVDITDAKTLSVIPNLKYDYLIHLAAIAAPNQCKENPKLAYDVNVLGTDVMLKWAKEQKVKKVIFLSSAHVYGISPKFMPTPEEAPLQLNDTYTTTKLLAERLCQLYYENHALPYLTFRLFNSYGKNQSLDYFIPAMIDKAKKGKIELSGAEVTKDWVYISDVVDAVLRGLKTDYVGALNIGTGISTKLETIAQFVAQHYGAKFLLAESQSKPTYMQADITRTNAILGWTPPTTLAQGLIQTLAWYDIHGQTTESPAPD